MDLTGISTEDLQNFQAGNLDKVSTDGLVALKALHQAPDAPIGERIKQDFANRDAEIGKEASDYVAGKKNMPETVAENALSNASKLTDVVGEGISSMTPKFVKNMAAGAVSAASNLPSNNPAAPTMGAEISGLMKENPRLSDALRAGGQALNLAGTVVAPKAIAKPVGAVGDAIEASGQAAGDAKRMGFLQDLITPKQTPTVSNELFTRSSQEGLLGKRVVEPSPQELSVMNTLHSTDVSHMKSLNTNYNIINDAKNAEADNLKSFLVQNDKPIDDTKILQTFQNVQNDLAQSPYLTSDGAEKAAKRVVDGALSMIDKQPAQTASGMLQARKDFDAWVENYKKNAFDPATSGPVTDAVARVRSAMNGMIADAVPSADVRTSLQHQSNMYRAMDAIETKGGMEAKTLPGRLAQKMAGFVPAKTAIGKGAVLATAAGGGAAAPALAAGAGAAYLGGKALAAPITRKVAGGAVKSAADIARMTPQDAIKYLSKLRGP